MVMSYGTWSQIETQNFVFNWPTPDPSGQLDPPMGRVWWVDGQPYKLRIKDEKLNNK